MLREEAENAALDGEPRCACFRGREPCDVAVGQCYGLPFLAGIDMQRLSRMREPGLAQRPARGSRGENRVH